MLVQTAHLHSITREHYDALMAMGWFRGTGIVYRSEIVCIDEEVYAVQNIRFSLSSHLHGKSHRKILRMNKARFTVTVGEPFADAQKEALYQSHRKRFKAFVHESLAELIYYPKVDCDFESKELCVYDGEQLVAVSYFDVGKESIASILCVYDQTYNAFSPGIFTMLMEMEYGRRMGVEYYYPGYVLDKPSGFDYKLTLGECQWLGKDKQWHSKEDVLNDITSGELIRSKMAELREALMDKGYEPRFYIYPYFTIGQIMVERNNLVQVPCYFTFQHNHRQLAVSFDLAKNRFVVFDVLEEDELDFTQHLELSDDYKYSDVYDLRILKYSFLVPIELKQLASLEFDSTVMEHERI